MQFVIIKEESVVFMIVSFLALVLNGLCNGLCNVVRVEVSELNND